MNTSTAIVAQSTPLERMLADPDALAKFDVDKLERMIELRNAEIQRQAEAAFDAAFTEFQNELTPVPRTKKAHQSRYAPLDVILEHCKPLLTKYGFSWRWEFEDSPEMMRVTCVLSHINGHARTNSMSAEPDDSGGKNKIQARASANSYLERYTFVGVTGVTIEGEDNDGGKPAVTIERLQDHNRAVRENIQSVVMLKESLGRDAYDEAIEIYDEITDQDKVSLALAPTKGGVFSTAEIKQMKSNEWHAARKTRYGGEEPQEGELL